MEQDDLLMAASGWADASFAAAEDLAEDEGTVTPNTTNNRKTSGGNIITRAATRTASATFQALGLARLSGKVRPAPLTEIEMYSYDGEGAVKERSPKRWAEIQEFSGSRVSGLESPTIRKVRSASPGGFKTTGLYDDDSTRCKSHK